MKLNPNAFGLSLGIVSGIGAFLCSFFVGLFPSQTMSFTSAWFHMNVGGKAAKVTLFNAVSSIVISFFLAYAFGWLLAAFYNKFAKE